MACTITTGRGISCRDAIGGLRGLYVLVDSSDNPTILSEANTTVSAAEVTDISDTGLEAYFIDLTAESGSYNSALQASVENGTIFYEQTIELSLLKADSATINLLDGLAKVRTTFLAHDNNDNVYVVGFGNGAELTGNTMETGMGYGDKHGFSVTITTKTKTPPYMLARTAGAGTTNYPLDGLTTNDIAVNAASISPTFG